MVEVVFVDWTKLDPTFVYELKEILEEYGVGRIVVIPTYEDIKINAEGQDKRDVKILRGLITEGGIKELIKRGFRILFSDGTLRIIKE